MEKAVRSIDGVVDVEINLDTQQVTVDYDNDAADNDPIEKSVREAIEKSGYTVQ